MVGTEGKESTLLIELDEVSKAYTVGTNVIHALSGVSFRVEEGEFVAVMGASGSGKSTLMSILGGLDRPSQGKYFFDGLDMSRLSRDELARVRNERMGFVFQSFNLLPRTTALENVELPLYYAHGITPARRSELAREALERVGLGDRIHHRPNQLSGGQQQRVAIARALVNKPALLLADEPTGNLDSKVTAEIMRLLLSLNEQGNTIIFVTHEHDVAQYAKRKIVLRDGKILTDEPIVGRTAA